MQMLYEALLQENIEIKATFYAYKIDAETTKNNLEKRLEQYQLAYEQIQHQLNELIRHRFGSRSEKFIDDDNLQLSLFTSNNETKTVGEPEAKKVAVNEHTRVVKKKKNTDDLPRMIVIIPVSDEDKKCACGCEKTVIRHETKELLDYQPGVLRIVEQRREVVACTHGCEGSMKTAPAPLHVLPKVTATEALLSHIIVSKLHDRQPLYHLEKHHLDISRETMARWMINLYELLLPIFNLLQDEVLAYDIASVDATYLQVLKEPGRPPQKTSYAYCMRGGPPDHSVILYGYNYEEHSAYVDQWFEGFRGSVHLDAGSVFNVFAADVNVTKSLCNAHARRKFEAIKKSAKKPGLAVDALRFYKQLYLVEREAKDLKLPPNERHQLRQEKSVPIMKAFKEWLDTHVSLILPKSPLGEAFNYCIKHWIGLSCFLSDGRLEIDNNLTEQAIKSLALARKNFMFADTMNGAHALCLHFSLLQTALAHSLDPRHYYTELLKRIPHCQFVEDYEKLLPWNIFALE